MPVFNILKNALVTTKKHYKLGARKGSSSLYNNMIICNLICLHKFFMCKECTEHILVCILQDSNFLSFHCLFPSCQNCSIFAETCGNVPNTVCNGSGYAVIWNRVAEGKHSCLMHHILHYMPPSCEAVGCTNCIRPSTLIYSLPTHPVFHSPSIAQI